MWQPQHVLWRGALPEPSSQQLPVSAAPHQQQSRSHALGLQLLLQLLQAPLLLQVQLWPAPPALQQLLAAPASLLLLWWRLLLLPRLRQRLPAVLWWVLLQPPCRCPVRHASR
jgi:hypothetical protein